MRFTQLATLAALTLFASQSLAAVWFFDADADGFGDGSNYIITQVQPPNHVANAGDCDDLDPMINPASPEICGNAVDEDCDAWLNNGCDVWFADADGDGHGDYTTFFMGTAPPSGFYALPGDDCNDANGSIYKGAPEVCGDGVDNNCDTFVDSTCNLWHEDQDGDGYGDPGQTINSVTQPANYVADGTDCDDGDAQIHPNATEICDNSVDEDCDGADLDCAVSLQTVQWGSMKSTYR